MTTDQKKRYLPLVYFNGHISGTIREVIASPTRYEFGQWLVECVNACADQNIEDVKLATEHRNACMQWEQLMMELVGADGMGSVREAIEQLKAQRDAAFAELKAIRDHIGADENESTYDEVVRLTINRKSVAT